MACRADWSSSGCDARCVGQVHGVDADGAQCMVSRRSGERSLRRLLPEQASGRSRAVELGNAVGHGIAEGHRDGRQRRFQGGDELLCLSPADLSHRDSLSWRHETLRAEYAGAPRPVGDSGIEPNLPRIRGLRHHRSRSGSQGMRSESMALDSPRHRHVSVTVSTPQANTETHDMHAIDALERNGPAVPSTRARRAHRPDRGTRLQNQIP